MPRYEYQVNWSYQFKELKEVCHFLAHMPEEYGWYRVPSVDGDWIIVVTEGGR